ncbi:hypothetical protein BB8028_0003g15700 [Beauveria bassiana]|uniref:RRM domain-containing protein n=1 Tax=Beauveria bassiana TaxID=176275 RepID=A0A2S7Y9Y6_BEABA|nr:hypothetical protein BB8028_0003g15700 [Beauveria bassiana]
METSKNRIHGRLYVGGLSYTVDDDELRALLSPFGQVEFVKVVRDFNSGRSKGFGFVEMATMEEAKEAVDKLQGSIYEGGTITVSFASSEDASQGVDGLLSQSIDK